MGDVEGDALCCRVGLDELNSVGAKDGDAEGPTVCSVLGIIDTDGTVEGKLLPQRLFASQ